MVHTSGSLHDRHHHLLHQEENLPHFLLRTLASKYCSLVYLFLVDSFSRILIFSVYRCTHIRPTSQEAQIFSVKKLTKMMSFLELTRDTAYFIPLSG